MKYAIILAVFLLTLFWSATAQRGHLMIVGGGSESNDYPTSWNAEPYQWAVDQSKNKKVAVLHYSSTSSWLEDYFMNHCDATEAKSYVVNSSNANSSALMEELMGYDVFFFRGGNQEVYYEDYNGTLMEQTIKDKYEDGGVIGGTSAGLAILSGVIFYAGHGSVYSDEVIKNFNDNDITLADDFLDFMPGYLFDSHFRDRGRLGRLVAFLSNYYKTQAELITGIGVDGTTALCIDSGMMATAYGTGAVGIYEPVADPRFGAGNMVLADSIWVSQLLHGDQIDLNTGIITGLENEIIPFAEEENGKHILFLSGSDEFSPANIDMLEKFAGMSSPYSDTVLIISGTDITLASLIKDKLLDFQVPCVHLYEGTAANSENEELKEAIDQSGKFLLVNNTTYNFNVFRLAGPVGEHFDEILKRPGTPIAMIGDNARFAGNWIIGNYASSSANFNFSEGYAFLKSTLIVPKCYDIPVSGFSTELWDGTHAALPFGMVTKADRYGLWLNNENYMVYKPHGKESYFHFHGTSPVMMLKQFKNQTGIAEQTYNGQPSEIPKMVAGFEKLLLGFYSEGDSVKVGGHLETGIPNPGFILTDNFNIKKTQSHLTISLPDNRFDVSVYTITGQLCFQSGKNRDFVSIPTHNWEKGTYIVQCISEDLQQRTVRKINIVK